MPTVPLAVAFSTTRVGRVSVTVWPPMGEVAAGAERLPGVAAAALCVTVTIAPATVSVAERAAPVFAATENVTVPLPLPEAPPVIVTNVAPLVAVHAQAAVVLTVTDPLPPVAANDEAFDPTAITQDGVVLPVVLPASDPQAVARSSSAIAEAPVRRRLVVGGMLRRHANAILGLNL